MYTYMYFARVVENFYITHIKCKDIPKSTLVKLVLIYV